MTDPEPTGITDRTVDMWTAGQQQPINDQDDVACIRCCAPMLPGDQDRRVCSRAPDGGYCEPPRWDDWQPGHPVRWGSSAHAGNCDRANPSVWLPDDMPCTCSRTASDPGRP